MTVRGGSRGMGMTATLSLGTGTGTTGNNLGNNLQQQFNPNPNAVDDLTVLVWCCGCKTKSLVGIQCCSFQAVIELVVWWRRVCPGVSDRKQLFNIFWTCSSSSLSIRS